MDNIEILRPPSKDKKKHRDDMEKDSVENFQKFICELFEKNGILNDLRAYLRRHIVDLLKSSQSGDTPICRRNFAQRLELKTQAMNMLIAEYLLCSECNYSLSVFVSEIPLANMVFDFANSLMKDEKDINLRFNDKDILSIINYLGIKCDSNLVNNILDCYKNDKSEALLLSIMKCLSTTVKDSSYMEPGAISPVLSLSSIYTASTYSVSDKYSKKHQNSSSKCRHYAVCKSCHNRLIKLKNKYSRKVKEAEKRETSAPSVKVKSLIKNISNFEGNLINEVFGQLKSVYEAEAEMVRLEQDRRIREAYEDHANNLQAERAEMEEAFKAREEELERGVRAKKKFLWGLARSLRDQHDHLARAMAAVKYHTQRLRSKEESLKAQLTEVQQLLKTRGEDMKAQISNELIALEDQLDTVRREREAVCRERSELEQLKIQLSSSQANIHVEEIDAMSEHASSNYDLLRNELSVLRSFIENTREHSKCVASRSTAVTDSNDKNSELLNNEQEVKAVREEDSNRLKNNQLVNDFKKQKNVNFSMSNMEEAYVEKQDAADDTPCADESALAQLRQENERLKEYVRQREQETFHLSAVAARLQTELAQAQPHNHPHPHPLPSHTPPHPTHTNTHEHSANEAPPERFPDALLTRTNPRKPTPRLIGAMGFASLLDPAAPQSSTPERQNIIPGLPSILLPLNLQSNTTAPGLSALRTVCQRGVEPPCGGVSSYGWRCKGAGEETTMYVNMPPPRVFLPNDEVPFIGLVHDRYPDTKRKLMNQWRMARRTSPLRARRSPSPSPSPRAPHALRSPPRVAPALAPHTPRPRGKAYTDENSATFRNENMDPNKQVDILKVNNITTRTRNGEAYSGAGSRAGGGGGGGRHMQAPPTTPTAPPAPAPAGAARAKSPKSVLREAKERLRTSTNTKIVAPPAPNSNREKSPSTVLREAKMRLRKLEIEAEAVEKSYMDYRKRQNEMRSEREQITPAKEEFVVTKDTGNIKTKNRSSFAMHKPSSQEQRVPESQKTVNDFATFLREYRETMNLSDTQFGNRNTAAVNAKPIPDAYSPRWSDDKSNEDPNYLETPLEEFRKHYRPEDVDMTPSLVENETQPLTTKNRTTHHSTDVLKTPTLEHLTEDEVKELAAKKDALMKAKNSKQVELEILKQNISKIYNILDEKKVELTVSQDIDSADPPITKERKETNLLRVEVENANRVDEITVEEVKPSNLVVMVQSTLETNASEPEMEALRPNMTILISPARSPREHSSARSVSPEQAARLTRNDVLEAIFHAGPDKVASNYEVNDEASKGEGEGEGEETPSEAEGGKELADDYPDDFSADVDNYDHSRADESPLSGARSRDDRFWDDSHTY